MTRKTDPRRRAPPSLPNLIVGSTADGIKVRVDGEHEVRPWNRVTAMSAALLPYGLERTFVLAIEFEDSQTFVISEVEPAWPELVELLPVALPPVEPFSSWGPKIVEQTAAIHLYQRTWSPSGKRRR